MRRSPDYDVKDMDKFFIDLKALEESYIDWTNDAPKYLYLNPTILQKLSRVTGFYQRPELGTEVTMHAPVVRFLKLKRCVVEIIEDYDEKFMHFE